MKVLYLRIIITRITQLQTLQLVSQVNKTDKQKHTEIDHFNSEQYFQKKYMKQIAPKVHFQKQIFGECLNLPAIIICVAMETSVTLVISRFYRLSILI
jgi:hypothetical protein